MPATGALSPAVVKKDCDVLAEPRVARELLPNASSNGGAKTPKEYWSIPTVSVKQTKRTDAISQPNGLVGRRNARL